jgi:hypothetical protein
VKLLVAAEHHPITPARYMVEAFAALPDVDVRHIGNGRGGNTGFSDDARPDLTWEPQGDYQHHWPDWKPDVILYLETISDYYHHEGYAKVPHIWYHVEGLMDNVMPGMAHYFHAASYGPNWDKVPEKMTWLPPAYDPRWHTPSAIPWEEREYDVCLVGRLGDRRDKYIKAFRAVGLKVFWGVGYINEDYAAIYHNSRLSLIDHFRGIVPMRTFESAAMGNLLFSQWFADYDKLGIQGVVHLPENIETAVAFAKGILRQPDKCKQLVAQSMAWVQPHTYAARAQTIVDWYTSR